MERIVSVGCPFGHDPNQSMATKIITNRKNMLTNEAWYPPAP